MRRTIVNCQTTRKRNDGHATSDDFRVKKTVNNLFINVSKKDQTLYENSEKIIFKIHSFAS